MITPDDTKPGDYVYTWSRHFGASSPYRQQFVFHAFEGDVARVAPTPAECARRRAQARRHGRVLRDRPEDARYTYPVADLHRVENQR
jgi:hypothetical protein